MMRKQTFFTYLSQLLAIIIAGAILFTSSSLFACTRVVYQGINDNIITARSMDWKTGLNTKLWILPRDVKRDGSAGDRSIKWTSKYGSVVISSYDLISVDGLNEKGLNANLLWLVTSQYPDSKNSQKPTLSLSLWAQYVLDNFATVNEAVKVLEKEPFIVITGQVPGQSRDASLHLSISDSSGDSAIIEYIDGKQVIHHSKAYQVMTNEPKYEDQLAIDAYWKQRGGTVFLPGTNKSSDRFSRASFYINAIPKTEDPREAIASAFSVIRNVSVPYGINTENEPNISSTRWRTVVGHKQKLYFFESVKSPFLVWINLKTINFADKNSTKVLNIGKKTEKGNYFSGDVTKKFKTAKPFVFSPAI